MNKLSIRKKILKIRKENRSENIELNFFSLEQMIIKNRLTRKSIGAYYPYNFEIDITKILKNFEKKGYSILLPKIRNNNQMDFFKWSTNDPLQINKYGIPEPTSSKIFYPDIIFIPIVAFDKDFNRIGYGGGYYDRYLHKLKKIKKIFTIGFAYSFQKVKKIESKKHDVRLDYVFTEKTN